MTAPVEHSFVIPAFGYSPHLEDCLRSLKGQQGNPRILITTSTPSPALDALAHRYDVPLRVNPLRGGIGEDWNFALASAETPWVTLAHQDDIYLPDFLPRTLAAIRSWPDALLVFTDYAELRGAAIRSHSTLLWIKRILLELAFLGGSCTRRRFFKMNALRFGCAIPCPTVTLNLDASGLRFRRDMKVNLDWAAWLDLAHLPGPFVFVRERLVHHRVHASSETSNGIAGGQRQQEDAAILDTLWPPRLARAIAAAYRIAYRSNED